MKFNVLDENFPQSEIDELSKFRIEEIEIAYSQIKNTAAIEQLRHETREMIPQIDGRINFWESRRTLFLQISLGILAASLAAVVALAPKASEVINSFYKLENLFYIPIFISSIILITGCIRLLHIWNKQNNPDYSFTKGAKIWRWQYRSAEIIPNRTDFENFDMDALKEEAKIFTNNSVDYKIKTFSSTSFDLLDQDLSQLYLLLINEKFKVKFVSALRNELFSLLEIAFYSLVVTLGVLLLFFVDYFYKIII